jgi:D-alanine-D-alanine ligase
MEFPLIVKPIHEDASLGIHQEAVVWDPTQLERQINYISGRYDQPALVESFVEGRELNVSLVGDGELRVLPISEIDFSDMPPDVPRICSYRAKWVLDSPEYQGTKPVCPALLPPAVEERVKGIALEAFSLVGCRDYGRVDIRLDKADVPYVLEVNPNPAISMNEGLARSVATSGMSYGDFIAEIVGYAYRRKAAFKNKEANRPG